MERGAGPYRLERGGLIDRTRSISFQFDGRPYSGFAGDTLAAALLANGVRTVARSFKFHRPRGVFSCGPEEPNALIQLGSGARAIPTARAPMVELSDGLEAHAQAGWPSLGFDLGRLLDLAAPLWAAGFYNKTFMWPGWHVYERTIRRLAGLGRASLERDPDRYDVRNAHCDVLVVGGGAAGLGAALRAALAGERVVLAEQDSQLGGHGAWAGLAAENGGLGAGNRGAGAGNAAGIESLTAAGRQLDEHPDVKILRRTTAVGYYDHDVVAMVEHVPQSRANGPRERYWVVRAKRVVLATGSLEQPLIFSHNDRPGIMLAGSARQYLRRYGVAPGRRTLVATNNDSAYLLAQDLKNAGAEVAGIVDSRQQIPEALHAAMRSASIEVLAGSMPIESAGFSGLRRMTVGRLSSDGTRVESARMFECDALAVSGGWSPALHLYAQAGGKLAYDEASGALQPCSPHASIQIVGTAAEAGTAPIGPRSSPIGSSRRQWVDLLHDVTVADLELALRENYTSVEHVKRYTTVGMAADQGKTSTATTIGVLAKLRGIRASALGHTTMRPPFVPVTLGAIAGRAIGEHFAPHRLLPMHRWHTEHGALIEDFGEWRRPVAYPHSGESRERASLREARAVRNAAGLLDSSPLGKIELRGPDALGFLDRFYVNNLQTLKPGRVRYGLMLRESGVIFDDGTVAMLAPDHLVITTTSGNAGRVGAWLEEWHQCEWPQLRLAITPVSEQWATISVTGPKARTIAMKLDANIDWSGQAIAHMTIREGTLLGWPARIYRVSYTGELTFEINVPAGNGQSLWEALLQAGAPEALQPVGLEALLLLRLEKGFLHVGTDTDGTTIPDDVGWGQVAANKQGDYVGKRSLSLPESRRADRMQLVGLTGQRDRAFAAGSHLRLPDSNCATDGWITSAGLSVSTGDPIALAVLRAGRKHVGAAVSVHDAGSVTGARVVNPPFFDPRGDRLHA
ncbi:MAG: 2Fe-2S iron-sulfur cluster-binding protein [Steroidobacteraceae bacterium]